MSEQFEDLWPSTFNATSDDDPAPVMILRQQADLLSGKTGGVVQGCIRDNTEGGAVFYSLYLSAPALGDYMFKVLSIAMPLAHLHQTDPLVLDAQDAFEGETKKVDNVDQFKKWLRSVLQSEAVKGVVSNMIQRSTKKVST